MKLPIGAKLELAFAIRDLISALPAVRELAKSSDPICPNGLRAHKRLAEAVLRVDRTIRERVFAGKHDPAGIRTLTFELLDELVPIDGLRATDVRAEVLRGK